MVPSVSLHLRALVKNDGYVDSNLLAHIPNPKLREKFVPKYQLRQVTGERCFDIAFLRSIEFRFLDDFERWG